MMEKTRKALECFAENLIKALKDDLSSGPVCDSNFKCKGWEKYFERIHTFVAIESLYNLDKTMHWKFCPWCGKEIKENQASKVS